MNIEFQRVYAAQVNTHQPNLHPPHRLLHLKPSLPRSRVSIVPSRSRSLVWLFQTNSCTGVTVVNILCFVPVRIMIFLCTCADPRSASCRTFQVYCVANYPDPMSRFRESWYEWLSNDRHWRKDRRTRAFGGTFPTFPHPWKSRQPRSGAITPGPPQNTLCIAQLCSTFYSISRKIQLPIVDCILFLIASLSIISRSLSHELLAQLRKSEQRVSPDDLNGHWTLLISSSIKSLTAAMW